jgi:GAF domain-containing protein
MPRTGLDGQPHTAVDYDLLERQAASLLKDERDFIANCANFAAFMYDVLPLVNWAGFYFPNSDGLVLGPFGGKPACTRLPKGRGVCGKAFEGTKTVVVDDVEAFADHIVCDSASRSEIVVPLMHENAVYGVFDIDSPVLARFQETDKVGIERLVRQFVTHTPLPAQYRTERPGRNGRINERIDVQTCRDHHSVLRYLLDDMDKEHTTPAEMLALLKRFRSVLLAHLKLEDDWLYPRLGRSENSIVQTKAERYRREMGGLRDQFAQLWRKWSIDGAIESNAQGWRSDFHAFRRALLGRIDTEDHDLYVAAETDLA